MKKIILTLIASLFCLSINAQIQSTEVELFGGITFPTYKPSIVGPVLGTEVRFNLLDGKISPGVQLALSGFQIKENNATVYSEEQFVALQGLCDYNFKLQKNVVPFVGIGFSVVAPNLADLTNGNDCHLSVPVRIGCEFYRRIRVSVDYIPMKHSLSYFSTRLGFVIGGRNKK